MMGVVITAANEITLQALSNGIKKEELADYLNTNNVPALKEAIGFGGLQMIVLVVCCMIVYKLIKDTNSLANKFAGGAGINMGAQLGGTAASIATSVGKAAARTGGKLSKVLPDLHMKHLEQKELLMQAKQLLRTLETKSKEKWVLVKRLKCEIKEEIKVLPKVLKIKDLTNNLYNMEI